MTPRRTGRKRERGRERKRAKRESWNETCWSLHHYHQKGEEKERHTVRRTEGKGCRG